MRWFPCAGILYFAAAAPLALAAVDSPRVSREPLPTLHSARQAHDLLPAQALRNYPVHLKAVVTYYDPYIDPRHAALFVHDNSGAIFVMLPARPILPLQPGDLVDLQGQSAMGDYAPILDHAQVKYEGKSQLPPSAIQAAMRQLLSGRLDGQWVEVDGLVHAVHSSAANVTLDLATSDGSVSATTRREDGVDYDALIDARIRLHGNAGPQFNKKRQLVGVHLFFPNMTQVKVTEQAPHHPFDSPVVPISGLLQFTPSIDVPHRVHVQGRVTLRWPSRTLCIQLGKDGLCMETPQVLPVKVGDLLDVIGFPAISNYRATLEDALYQVASSIATPPSPVPVTADLANRAEHDGQLVQIEGQIVGQNRAAGDLTFMLRSGSVLIPAILANNASVSNQADIEDQSLVRVTGICLTQINPLNTNVGEGEVRPGSVQLLLRSLGDVQVVKAPSWWTTRNTIAVLVLAALVSLFALVWVVVLRRQVRLQTRALRSSEERLRYLSEHDALTNLPNRILLNDRMTMALHRARRFKEPIGLLMLDLDRFKEVNDVYGHVAGDQLLCEIACRICGSVRKTDTVARIGGDEFIVLLPDLTEPRQAQSIAAKVLAAVSAPIRVGRELVSVTVSIGVCTNPEGRDTIEDLMERVDAAMYAAKARGRNALEVFQPVEG
jgi:diguanylate cyclase (GGDEF)-like protein